jgi:hypothetical protein
VAFFLMVAVDEASSSRDAGRKQGFGKRCLPLLKRLRACRREDREIPAASIKTHRKGDIL